MIRVLTFPKTANIRLLGSIYYEAQQKYKAPW